ncbi:tail fiber protein [Nitrospirillum iridis]|uniref:Outer membrane protein assembly factor BamB n=1 Tax=Nitrospirillum iridis TaxID=765888 RepID=A0A7X0AX58_9PROT|nr:tail fiber protein [Nitrospirillum iridis]MBB6250946.1 outer membrane protein assembly factor BamB [Nitrospirillum iridis]
MDHFIGEIRAFPYIQRMPEGWLPCDGRSLACSGSYQALFSVIGRRFGGDLATDTFKLPDFRRGVPVGMDPRTPVDASGDAAWDHGVPDGTAGSLSIVTIRHFICVMGAAAPVAFRFPFTLQGGDARPTITGGHTLTVRHGRAVIFDTAGSLVWESGGDKGTALSLTRTGELVVTDADGQAVWRTHTQVAAGQDPVLLFHPDGRLAIVDSTGKEIWRNPDLTAEERKRGQAKDWERERTEQGRQNARQALLPGQVLRWEVLRSPNGRFTLELAIEGGLVVKSVDSGAEIWNLNKTVNQVGHLAMQTDGNLVLHTSDGKPVWATLASPMDKADHLVLSDEGEMLLKRGDRLVWSSGNASRPGRLVPGGRLAKGESLRSPNGAIALTLRRDGTLVLTDGAGKTLWTPDRSSPRSHSLVMQRDGNLVLEEEDRRVVWAAGTDDKSAHAPCHSLKVNDNGTITVSAPAGDKSWTSPIKT